MDSPLPSFSRIRSTVTRVPATTVFPIITLGSETIMGSLIVILLAMTLADSPHSRRITHMGRTRRRAARAEAPPPASPDARPDGAERPEPRLHAVARVQGVLAA